MDVDSSSSVNANRKNLPIYPSSWLKGEKKRNMLVEAAKKIIIQNEIAEINVVAQRCIAPV